jgi:hypothetical protein
VLRNIVAVHNSVRSRSYLYDLIELLLLIVTVSERAVRSAKTYRGMERPVDCPEPSQVAGAPPPRGCPYLFFLLANEITDPSLVSQHDEASCTICRSVSLHARLFCALEMLAAEAERGVTDVSDRATATMQPSLASDTAQTVPREITLTLADIGRLLGGEEFDDDPNEWYCDYWETWIDDPGLRTLSEQAKKDIATLKKDKVYVGRYILQTCVLAFDVFDIVPSISRASRACKRGRYRRISVRPR